MTVTFITAFAASSTAAGTTLTVSGRVSAAAGNGNLCLIGTGNCEGTVSVAGMAWDTGGVNQALLTAGVATATSAKAKMFYLAGPQTGEHILQATFSSASAARGLSMIVLASVDQTTPIEGFASNTGSGNGNTSAQVVSTANAMVVDSVTEVQAGVTAAANASAGTGQTERYEQFKQNGGSRNFGMEGSTQPGETSTRMSWDTRAGGLNGVTWVQGALNVRSFDAVSAGGGAVISNNLQVVGAGR